MTEQESFWRGDFGNAYTERNRGQEFVAANTAFFRRVLERVSTVHSALELGSNLGLNLMALRQLLPDIRLSAVEINERAASELRDNLPDADVYVTSIFDFEPRRTWDLVFTCGVLIHVLPAKLPSVYEVMYRSTSRYLLVSEYYNPTPIEIVYRGHHGQLFKRDFAGEIMESFPDVRLVDYGFAYHRDPQWAPQDDMNWFLLEKH